MTKQMSSEKKSEMNRRKFLASSAAVSAGLMVAGGRIVRAQAPKTADLNVAFENMVERHAPAGGSSAAQPKYLTQVGIKPPRFVAFAGGRGAGRSDYTRYLENRLRDVFDFSGSPVVITLRLSKRGGRRR